ncbi:MAG TPA: hypothetical protein VIM29_01650 [Bacillota bacterium]
MINGLVSEIVILDVNEERLEGEVMDLNHGISFVRPVKVRSGNSKKLIIVLRSWTGICRIVPISLMVSLCNETLMPFLE